MARSAKSIGTIDCETDPFKYDREPRPFCWGFFDGNDQVNFWGDDCTERLIDYLSTESDLILYAHNGGRFDFFYLLKYLDAELLIINGRIAKATLFNGQIEIRDSYLILPLPLSSFQKTAIDYDTFEKNQRQQNKHTILNYLGDDCLFLYQWVNRFIDEFGRGLTLAGAAFKQLKLTGYEVGRTFDQYDQMFRNFYFGGRVQCFDVGAFYGEHLYIDLNSAYSDAMTHQHWHGSEFIEGTKLPKTKNGSWFAEIHAVSRGALPYRDNDDDKLYFPDDNVVRTYCATGWEINAGLDTGTLDIKKVVVVYRPLYKQHFKAYVKKFFALKAHAKAIGDDTLYQFAKLMLNACYGKLGQDGRQFEKFCILEYGEVPEGVELDNDKDIDVNPQHWGPYADTVTGERIWSRPDPQFRFFNVATAASITGFVRAKLWRSICSSNGVLYCDTDSMICKSTSVDMDPTALGQWDIEARPVEIYIAQRKMYAMRMANYSDVGPVDNTKVASKGVRLSFDEIKNGVLTGSIITKYRDTPAFSLFGVGINTKKNSGEPTPIIDSIYGARFQPKKIDFSDLAKNKLSIPA